MRKLKATLGIVVFLIVGLFVTKNLIAKAVVIGGAKAITGLNVGVRSIHVGFPKTAVQVKGLRVMNPSGFPDSVMVEMPEIYVDYDLGSLLKGKPHLETIRLNLQELDVVKSADGKLNLNSIKALQAGKPAAAQTQPAASAPEFQIDVLELKVGKVVYRDYTGGGTPKIKEFAVNIDERYEHITNPYTFAGLVVTRALFKTTVGQLANFDVAGLQTNVANALKASAGALTETMTKGLGDAQAMSKQVLGNTTDILSHPGDVASGVKDTGKQALGAAKDAAGSLKKLFGGH